MTSIVMHRFWHVSDGDLIPDYLWKREIFVIKAYWGFYDVDNFRSN